ncbi:MAG TPA: hypothetical protein VFW11_14785 [Cyclobacteriaceae bacterium]|nr:hypothetical protein [Cyclobacteriaceae bacterium]
MFSFLKSSPPEIKVIDRIWMSGQAKWRACEAMIQVDPNCLFIAWFEETLNELRSVLPPEKHQCTILARDVMNVDGRMVIFVEHYPLASAEQALFEKLKLQEVPVLSSLDEPLFHLFGGEKMVEILKRLGMNDEEVLGHSMITKSIQNAQKKIGKQVIADRPTTSQQRWVSLNTNR